MAIIHLFDEWGLEDPLVPHFNENVKALQDVEHLIMRLALVHDDDENVLSLSRDDDDYVLSLARDDDENALTLNRDGDENALSLSFDVDENEITHDGVNVMLQHAHEVYWNAHENVHHERDVCEYDELGLLH